jgi:hypothetical protein
MYILFLGVQPQRRIPAILLAMTKEQLQGAPPHRKIQQNQQPAAAGKSKPHTRIMNCTKRALYYVLATSHTL